MRKSGDLVTRKGFSRILRVTALLWALGPAGSGVAEAPPGPEEGSVREAGGARQEPGPAGAGDPVPMDPGLPALRIHESWRHAGKIPARFRGLAEEPGRHFSLDSPSVRRLVEAALRENPGLKEAEAAWKAALQRVRVVSGLPDPTLVVVAFVESIETRVGPQEAALMLTQKLPWFGKPPAAGEAALEAALEKAWTWRSLQRETVLEVKEAFYELGYLAEALQVTDEDLATLKRYERIALTRYETGRGIQQNVVKVQTEITRLSQRRIVLGEQRRIARKRLALLAGRPLQETEAGATRETVQPVDLRQVRLPELVQKAQKNRDELQAGLHAVRARRQEVRLARNQYGPDLTLGLNYVVVGDRRDPAGLRDPPPDNGRDAVGVVAGINLPIWFHKVGAGVNEAELEEHRARAACASREDRAIFELQDAYISLESLGEQLALYQDALLPQARQALASSEAAYETGKVSFLELLDSERFLLSVRYGLARVKADYRAAQARMERALCAKFPDVERADSRHPPPEE